jgi:hypothetical protein
MQQSKLLSLMWRRDFKGFQGTVTAMMEFRCAATIAVTALH